MKNNIYLVVTAATDFYVDAWQFTEVGSSGISTIENSQPTKTQRYDLTGRRLTDTDQQHGIVIEQYTDQNGVKHTRKVVSAGDN